VVAFGAVGPANAHREWDVWPAVVADVMALVAAGSNVRLVLDWVTIHLSSIEQLLFEAV
jgi:hypothetical protein